MVIQLVGQCGEKSRSRVVVQRVWRALRERESVCNRSTSATGLKPASDVAELRGPFAVLILIAVLTMTDYCLVYAPFWRHMDFLRCILVMP